MPILQRAVLLAKYGLITGLYVSEWSPLCYLLRVLQALAVGAAEYNGPTTGRVKLDHHPGIRKTYPRRLLFNSKPFHCLTLLFCQPRERVYARARASR